MPNDFTITKITTPGEERWDTAYTVDSSGSISKYLATQGTYVDRPIKISITTPSASLVQGNSTISNSTVTRGTLSWNSGWINSGTLPTATFKNYPSLGVTYVDLSNDNEQSPILISDDYLYINKGYTDNVKISLAKLVPDMTSLVRAGNVNIQSGYSALDRDGNIITGTMPSATATITGTNTVSPAASISGNSYITLSTSNTTGISVTATGGGTASVTAGATTNTAGYAATSATLGSATLNANNNTTTATEYVTGVTLLAPSSGTRSFTISVPNGSNSNLINFVFTVDSSYNVTVTG